MGGLQLNELYYVFYVSINTVYNPGSLQVVDKLRSICLFANSSDSSFAFFKVYYIHVKFFII